MIWPWPRPWSPRTHPGFLRDTIVACTIQDVETLFISVYSAGIRKYTFPTVDDTQILGSCRPSASQDLLTRMSACIDKVAAWMRSNRLQLNTAKTEFLWSTTSRRLHQLPQLSLPGRFRPHFTSVRRSRPWNLHRQRCLDEVSRR